MDYLIKWIKWSNNGRLDLFQNIIYKCNQISLPDILKISLYLWIYYP
jgi:hypothetical protein